VQDRDRCRHGQHDEEPATKRTALLQLAKRDAGVFSVNELKKAADYHALFAKAKHPDRPRLRRLIGHVDAKRREQIPRAPREARAKIRFFIRVNPWLLFRSRSARRRSARKPSGSARIHQPWSNSSSSARTSHLPQPKSRSKRRRRMPPQA